MLKSALIAASVALIAAPASAAQMAPPAPDVHALVTPQLIDDFRTMLEAPVITMSIKAQNERRRDLTQGDLDRLDQQWRAETEADDQPLIAATLSSPASSYLTQVQAQSRGLFAALFIMDEHGLNVGQSAVTSDYWQGDEAKFKNTFPEGPDAVFIDEPEYDESFHVWLAQVNLTLAEDGRAIGSATVEINVTELARRARMSR